MTQKLMPYIPYKGYGLHIPQSILNTLDREVWLFMYVMDWLTLKVIFEVFTYLYT